MANYLDPYAVLLVAVLVTIVALSLLGLAVAVRDIWRARHDVVTHSAPHGRRCGCWRCYRRTEGRYWHYRSKF